MVEDFMNDCAALLYERGYNMPEDQPVRHSIFHRMDGSAGYMALIVNVDKFNDYELEQFLEDYSKSLRDEFENMHVKNLFLVYILVSEEEKNVTSRILEQAEPYDGQPIYEIFWAYPLSTKILSFNKVQPSEIAGLAAVLKAVEKVQPTVFKQRLAHPVILTYILIAFNGIIYTLLRIDGSAENPQVFVAAGALVPEYVFRDYQFYRILNAMFLHFDLMHLWANGLGLYIFGTITEKYFSKTSYLLIYFVAGLVGNICSLFTVSGMSLGASGAVYGLMGAALVVSHVAPRSVGMLNTYHIAIMSVVGIGVGFVLTNINNVAHISGMVAGAAVAYLIYVLGQRELKSESL